MVNATELKSSESDDHEIPVNSNYEKENTKVSTELESISYSDADTNYSQTNSYPSKTSSDHKIQITPKTSQNQNKQETPIHQPSINQKNVITDSHEYDEKSAPLNIEKNNKSETKLNSDQHHIQSQNKKPNDAPPTNVEESQQTKSNSNINAGQRTQNPSTNDFDSWIENSYIAEAEKNTRERYRLTFLREKGSLLKKENYRLLENHRVIYYSLENKDNIGHFTVISTEKPIDMENAYFQGFIRQNSKNNKFLLISKETRPHDDREGEICGIYFKNKKIGQMKTKELHLVLTADKKPYFAISKRLSLASIAKGETDDVPNVIKFISKSPEVNENGKLTLNLGDVFMVPSCKNMIICNDNGENIFVFVKINEGSFTIHCADPITPFIAFALSISIVKTL